MALPKECDMCGKRFDRPKQTHKKLCLDCRYKTRQAYKRTEKISKPKDVNN